MKLAKPRFFKIGENGEIEELKEREFYKRAKVKREVENAKFIGLDDSCWVEFTCECGESIREWCGCSGVEIQCPKCGRKYRYILNPIVQEIEIISREVSES
jgi:hypothetical protein